MDSAVPEHLRHALQRLSGLGEDADAADGAVEPVGDAHEDLPRLAVAFRDVGLHQFRKAFVAGLVTLGDLPDLLVHYEEVVVFVEYAGLYVRAFLRRQLSVFHTPKVVIFRSRCHPS